MVSNTIYLLASANFVSSGFPWLLCCMLVVVVRWQRTKGGIARTASGMSMESVRDTWDRACDFTHAAHPIKFGESSTPMYELLQELNPNAPGRPIRVIKNKTSGSSGINPVSLIFTVFYL